MNNEWFQCSIRFDKTMENGLLKKVTETYLVEALSYTEAERRIIEEMKPYIAGEFEVTDIKRARLSEIFESTDANADRFYKVKIAFITLDERSGEEKATAQNVLIQSTDFRTACKDLDKGMEGTLGDWIILSVSETRIMDIFHYKP